MARSVPTKVSVYYVDVGKEHPTGLPPSEIDVELPQGDRIISVETIKSPFGGYAHARVWIERG